MTTAELQAIAAIQYGTAGTVWHVKATGNDMTGDGLSAATAYATASKAATVAAAGDVILVLTDITDNGVINLQAGGTGQGVSLMGSEHRRVKITSNLTNTGIIVPGNGSRVRNLYCLNTASNYSYWIGVLGAEGSSAAHGVLIENCRFEADSDIVWTNINSNENWRFRDCEFFTKWDAMLITGTNIIVENCDFRGTGDSQVYDTSDPPVRLGGITGRGILVTGGYAVIRNCRFKFFGASTTNHGVTVQGSTAVAYLNDCKFHVYDGSSAYDVRTTNSGTIYLDGINVGDDSFGAVTKLVTSGTITSRPGTQPFTGGTGTRSVTITVNDGTNPIQGASVRIALNSADNQVGTTDANGQVAFSSAADGTYTVSIRAPGYSFTPTTLAVSGTVTHTYSMTQLVTVSDPGFVTGFATCYDGDGEPASDVTITMSAYKAGSASGVIIDDAARTAVSDATGLIQFPNLVPGWSYKFITNNKTVIKAIPSTAEDPHELASFVG